MNDHDSQLTAPLERKVWREDQEEEIDLEELKVDSGFYDDED